MSLRELIVETIRQELPALARECARTELSRQSRDVLLGEIELLFKHNPDVRDTVRRACDHELDTLVEDAISNKMTTNDNVKGAFREQCSKLLLESDGPFYVLLKLLHQIHGKDAIDPTTLPEDDQTLLARGETFVNLLADAVTLRFQTELTNGKKQNQPAA